MPNKRKQPEHAVTRNMTTPTTPPTFLSVREVANILRVKPQTVHVYLRRKIMPSYKFGDTTRIPREEFFRWLEACRTEAKA